jgi:D-alanine-D-alanine ligase
VSAHSLSVFVLAGGDSAERDVSLDSARGLAQAAVELGHRVLVADPARTGVAPTEDLAGFFGGVKIDEKPPEVSTAVFAARGAFLETLSHYKKRGIDVVLNGLHGGVGEDGTIQAVLDYIGIPCTGSGAAACALAMDKYRSKLLVKTAGVPVPAGLFFNRAATPAATITQSVRDNFSLPVVVKPNNQGSSVGLTVVESIENLDEAIARAFHLDENILIEEYIAGREITVAILEGEGTLPVMEIRPRSGLYDYYHKYQSGASEYLVPAPLDGAVADAIGESARHAFHLLGCKVYGRADFRLADDGRHFLLEVNTLPGMTALSLVPKAAKAAGIEYAELVSRILRLSLAR